MIPGPQFRGDGLKERGREEGGGGCSSVILIGLSLGIIIWGRDRGGGQGGREAGNEGWREGKVMAGGEGGGGRKGGGGWEGEGEVSLYGPDIQGELWSEGGDGGERGGE